MDFFSRNIPIKYLIISILIFVIALGFGGYKYVKLNASYNNLKESLITTTAELSGQITTLQNSLMNEEATNNNLTSTLQNTQAQNSSFQDQIQQMQGTVGSLVKLTSTDPELLKKYSKVYFLNENYAPAALTNIDPEFLWNPKTPIKSQSQVLSFLERMLTVARNDGVTIKVVSAYRSFSKQASLKSAYTVTYGSGANSFSADQGYSEHQLGSAMDLTTDTIGGNLVGFDKTKAYSWLQDNAYKFGFILSYPAHNSYYIFEPWHWRFVGVALATKLHDGKANFYDLDQHEIDTYLIKLFDAQ